MPDWGEAIRRRLAGLGLPPAREAEIVEELTQHAEDRFAELRITGMREDDARQTALDEIAGDEILARGLSAIEPRSSVEEPPRSMWGEWRQDLRYALRTMRKNPGFTAVAMLTLSLGIGANTAIFSVVNGVLLRPLPYPNADRLLLIYENSKGSSRDSVAYPNYLDWRRESRAFADMGAYRSDAFNFTGSGEPEQVTGKYVSASFFPVLEVTPLTGRFFLAGDDRQGAPCAVVISNGFWKRRFGADPNITANSITLNASSCRIVGVLRADFPFHGDVYLPLEQWNAVELRMREAHAGMLVVGRLKPDATMQSASADLALINSELARQYPATNAEKGAAVVPMKDDLVRNIRPTLLLLAGAVGFVLIIACANVANLLLARSTARRREFAIRVALGAERKRIVRQLLTESVLLAACAAVLGMMLAQWGTHLVMAAAQDSLPRAEAIGLDPYVAVFTLAVSMVTGVLFGLAPALQGANSHPVEFLKEGTRGAGGGRHRAEGMFVVLEVALAVILLAGAGLMMQSIRRLWEVDPGFNTNRILTAQVALSPKATANASSIRLAFRQLLDRVSVIPGVESAAITSEVPLGESDSEIPYWQGGGPQPPLDRMTEAMFYIVTPSYPAVLQFPLRRGRFFDERDRAGAPPVIVIDEVMAKHVFPGQDPVGERINLMALGPVQVIGVVGHVKHWGLDADDRAKIRDQVYFPFQQVPDKFWQDAVAGLNLMLRTHAEPLGVAEAMRAAVAGPTRDQPVFAVRTMEQIVGNSLAERRFTMLVLIVFAAAALLLAALGIYGVMSYSVTRRTHEFGIRATLGATRGEIVALVVGQGMKLAGAGLGVGLAAAIALTRWMARLLYGVRPTDPLTLAAVALLLGGIAALACYLPARRATALDPTVALRCE